LKAVSGKDFAKLLERRGWILLRITGSHHIFGKAGERARLTVPVRENTNLKRELRASLMKLAGIDERDL
jgi:predicted RNA binding protein YcfA (HicA-like mRNA interferase family)